MSIKIYDRRLSLLTDTVLSLPITLLQLAVQLIYLFTRLFSLAALPALVLLGVLYLIAYVDLWGSWLPPAIAFYELRFANAHSLSWVDNNKLGATEVRLLLDGDDETGGNVRFAAVSWDVRRFGVRQGWYSPVSMIQIPALPSGDWITINIGVTPDGKQITFNDLCCSRLPGVQDAWHPEVFEYSELEMLHMQGDNDHVKLVQHPRLTTPGHRAVLKYAEFADAISNVSQETAIYKRLRGFESAPEFLGHVAKKGRIVGFLLEHIDGVLPTRSSKEFTYVTLVRCRDALAKLHKDLYIAHNDPHPGHCLLRPNGTVILVDFDHATHQRPGFITRLDRKPFERDLATMGEYIAEVSDFSGFPS